MGRDMMFSYLVGLSALVRHKDSGIYPAWVLCVPPMLPLW